MILKITPVPKPRMTQSDRWKKRPCVVRYRAFADELRILAAQNNYIVKNPLSVTFVLPMPKSWSKKKKLEMDGKPHTQTPDLDNLLKAFQDVLLKDDSGVHTYKNVRKIWGIEGLIIINEELLEGE